MGVDQGSVLGTDGVFRAAAVGGPRLLAFDAGGDGRDDQERDCGDVVALGGRDELCASAGFGVGRVDYGRQASREAGLQDGLQRGDRVGWLPGYQRRR